jgi:hypothetical protein
MLPKKRAMQEKPINPPIPNWMENEKPSQAKKPALHIAISL